MLFLVAVLKQFDSVRGPAFCDDPMEGTMKKFVIQVVKTIVAVFVRAARLLT